MAFEAGGGGGYYYIIDNNTGEELFKGQYKTFAEAEAAAARLNNTTVSTEAAPSNKTGENKVPEDGTSGTNTTSTQSAASGTTTSDESAASGGGNASSGAGKSDFSGKAGPGIRQINPLSKFSSYTYSLVLYMLTPEAMGNFVEAGGSMSLLKGTGKGVYIVAQSGGINSKTEDRALTLSGELGHGEPGLDYYIDDLKLTTIMPGDDENKATVGTEIKFKIIDPSSFLFLQELAKASKAITRESKILSYSGESSNGFDQQYVLGIKFYGYDVSGNVMTASDPEVAGYDNGGSDGDKNAVIQRYFGLTIKSVKFKLDNKVTNFNFEGVVMSDLAAFSQKNGTVKSAMTITAGTVAEALGAKGSTTTQGISQILNEEGKDQKDRNMIKTPTKFKFEFYDENGSPVSADESIIGRASLINKATATPENAPLSPTLDSSKVTIADSAKSNSININKKTISVAAGQNIVNVIDNIIVKSNFITDALSKTMSQDAEAETIKKSATATLQWYSIVPYAKPIAKEAGNWVYEITYQIRPYSIPYIRSDVAAVTSKYEGPFKFYHYYFTGKNTEVLEYTQEYDNLYYVISEMSTATDPDGPKNGTGAPKVRTNASESDRTGGDDNKGGELNDQVRAQLYSPSDQNKSKIKILGDPDFIMTTVGVKYRPGTKYHSGDGSINPNSGQVFVQMTFNTALDYGMNPDTGEQTGDGLMNITDKVQFYESPAAKKAGIDGIVYMVTSVESTFSKGSFLQTLHTKVPPIEDLIDTNSSNNSDVDSSGRMKSSSNSGTAQSGQTTAVNNAASATSANGAAATGDTADATTATDVRTSLTDNGSGNGENDNANNNDGDSSAASAPPITVSQEPPNNTTQGDTVKDDTTVSYWQKSNDDDDATA